MAVAVPLIAAGITAAGSIGSAMLARRKSKQTPIQGQQKELIDQIMASLKGDGPFSSLFNVDEASFQKSFVDPMKQKFESQIAPQIQQSFISSGEHRGSVMQGALARAGVDMDQLLNEYYAKAQEGAQNRQMSAMSGVLGMGAGAAPGQSMGDALGQGAAGYLGGKAFPKSIDSILDAAFKPKDESIQDTYRPIPKGFEGRPQTYNYATGVMGN